MSAHERAIEARELVARLKTTEFEPLVRALAEQPECFTAGGRINCSAVARHLGCQPAEAQRMLTAVREMRADYF